MKRPQNPRAATSGFTVRSHPMSRRNFTGWGIALTLGSSAAVLSACGKNATATNPVSATSSATGTATSTASASATNPEGSMSPSTPATSSTGSATSTSSAANPPASSQGIVVAATPPRTWTGTPPATLSAAAQSAKRVTDVAPDSYLGVVLSADYTKVEVYSTLPEAEVLAALTPALKADTSLVKYVKAEVSQSTLQAAADAVQKLDWKDLGLTSVAPGVISQSVDVGAEDPNLPPTTERGKKLVNALSAIAREYKVNIALGAGETMKAY